MLYIAIYIVITSLCLRYASSSGIYMLGFLWLTCAASIVIGCSFCNCYENARTSQSPCREIFKADRQICTRHVGCSNAMTKQRRFV